MTPGIHLFHKPEGPTSFSIVQQCIGATPASAGRRRPRICHGGTLDPFSSGLLLILVEPATRLFDYLHAVPKVYRATIRWGAEMDNGDLNGKVTFAGDPCGLTPARLDEALGTFNGWHEQVPPATSAKRIGGERAYIRVQRGESVVMPPSRVYMHQAKWIDHQLPQESRVELVVRGGYYVRALARDLGRLVGCGAHLGALHRSAIGPWQDPGPGRNVEIHGRDVLPWAPVRILTDQEVGELREERMIAQGDIQPGEWSVPAGFPDPQAPIRGFHRDRLCFLLQLKEGQLGRITPLRGGL